MAKTKTALLFVFAATASSAATVKIVHCEKTCLTAMQGSIRVQPCNAVASPSQTWVYDSLAQTIKQGNSTGLDLLAQIMNPGYAGEIGTLFLGDAKAQDLGDAKTVMSKWLYNAASLKLQATDQQKRALCLNNIDDNATYVQTSQPPILNDVCDVGGDFPAQTAWKFVEL
jgi:hypothetical protein